jgi:hypothetical protein
MDYIKHYEALCYGRQSLERSKQEGEYYELHHILPRSLGGSNTQENLVLLTAREHYIAHLLLYNIYKKVGGVALRKMAFALVSMLSKTNTDIQRFSARSYSTMKEAARNTSLGRKVENTVNYRKPKSENHKEAIRKARLQAPPRSQETREKLRGLAKRVPRFSTNRTKSTCIYCKKEGQTTAMKRWHFENCKERKEVGNA